MSDNALLNEHLQILFLDGPATDRASGRLVYRSAFYDADGNSIYWYVPVPLGEE